MFVNGAARTRLQRVTALDTHRAAKTVDNDTARYAAQDDPPVGHAWIEQAHRRATPILIDVLSRYPEVPAGKSRVAQLMTMLDRSLRTLR